MTQTREQLASIEAEVFDCAEELEAVLATIDGDYCTWTTGPEVKSVRDRLRKLAACLAAPPPEPSIAARVRMAVERGCTYNVLVRGVCARGTSGCEIDHAPEPRR